MENPIESIHRRMKIEEALISTGIPFTMRVTPEWIKEG